MHDADGYHLAVDPERAAGYDHLQFSTVLSPFFVIQSSASVWIKPFSLVESHPNRTRRLSFAPIHTTLFYKEVEGEG